MDFHKPRYTPMSRRRRIYEGKAKVLYEGPEPGTLIQHFKDDATAFNAKKHDVIEGKGVLNNRISEYVFQHLNEIGVPTHFIRRLNMREQLIREVEIIPLEVVVRNVAAGSLSQRLGIEEGTQLPRSAIRWCRRSTSRLSAGRRPRRSMTSCRSPSGSTTSSPACFSASEFASWISRWNAGGCGKMIRCGSWWRTRSRPTHAGCGTSSPARSSTRTASVATLAVCSKPIRRLPNALASWGKASGRRAPGRFWSRAE